MKMMIGLPLFHLLLYCTALTAGVRIESVPAAGSDGVIQTEISKTVSLVCQHDGSSDTQDELVWLRNGAIINLKEGNTNGRSSVCVSTISQDNGATFACRLKKNSSVSSSVSLDVKFPPQISNSETLDISEEETLVLSCNIEANPQVTNVSWTLNGSRVDLLGGAFTVTNDGYTSQLTTRSVERGLHQGTYECRVESPLYGPFSRAFSVTVLDKTLKFPLMPIIAGLVVIFLTALLAVASRWNKIRKCCK